MILRFHTALASVLGNWWATQIFNTPYCRCNNPRKQWEKKGGFDHVEGIEKAV
jgi:hypothetical protein